MKTNISLESEITIFKVGEFWDTRPCNIRHSLSEVGTEQYFNEVEWRKYFVEPHIPAFAEFDRWKGGKVLEIGCGIGTDAVNFARAGADYTGIELSERSLNLTKKRFQIFGLKGRFYRCNAEELLTTVPVEKYDLIYSFGVIHHTPHPQTVIDSVKNYMEPDSEFRLMMYAKDSWKNIMIDAGFDQPEAQFGCPIAFTYTQEELRQMLSDFEVIDICQEHIFPYVVEKYVQYEYEIQPWFKAMPENMFRALEKALGWHTLIKCRLKD